MPTHCFWSIQRIILYRYTKPSGAIRLLLLREDNEGTPRPSRFSTMRARLSIHGGRETEEGWIDKPPVRACRERCNLCTSTWCDRGTKRVPSVKTLPSRCVGNTKCYTPTTRFGIPSCLRYLPVGCALTPPPKLSISQTSQLSCSCCIRRRRHRQALSRCDASGTTPTALRRMT